MDVILNDTSYSFIIWQITLTLIIALWLYSLIDILKNSFDKNDKIIWILVVILIPIIGSILYLFIGRKLNLS
ncbi:PLDc N-terminal domain-containing protein [Bizionia myxarmorum]|uniref:Cardiolipin synthase N-terminal domain-containing protein n=1 Tax=Bizionia myxarmorum TaxID=291186 RepID=A0A5D0R2P4_9FLAO|nr:PLDc N-terminal domain-containing protein [Bizionia myxarmorum]TYB75850.1 hypothetical protein ES674_13590 [Bizionia myxarmorum]